MRVPELPPPSQDQAYRSPDPAKPGRPLRILKTPNQRNPKPRRFSLFWEVDYWLAEALWPQNFFGRNPLLLQRWLPIPLRPLFPPLMPCRK